MHLRDIGVDVLACSSIRELPFLADRSDVILVLSDGAEPFGLSDALRAIEGSRRPPVVLLVGDVAIPWTPRPSKSLVILAPLAFLEWPPPLLEAPSEPELPFTD